MLRRFHSVGIRSFKCLGFRVPDLCLGPRVLVLELGAPTASSSCSKGLLS